MLDSRALISFILLAEELHFGRTAARLGVAQSAVSTQLLRLEEQVGARLLTRGRRSLVRLTPAGDVFLAEARAALAQLRRAEQIGRLAGRGDAGELSVGYVFSAAVSGVLSAGLAALATALPALNATPEPSTTPGQIDAVADGLLDIGIVRPRLRYPTNVVAAVVHSEEMVLALAETHPLAADWIDPSALIDQTFIIPQFDEGSGLGGHVVKMAERARFHPLPFVETRDFVTAISLAASGTGVSLVPASIARVAMPGLRYCQLHGDKVEVELALIWRQGGAHKAAEIMKAGIIASSR